MVCLLKRLTDSHCDISINLLFLFVLLCFADYCTTSSCGPLWGRLDTIYLWIYCSYFFLLPLFSRAQSFKGWLVLTQNARLNFNLGLFDSFVNPLILESDQHLQCNFSFQYHLWIKHEGNENKGNDNWLKNLLIVKQILLASTSGNVKRLVQRVCILMLGCKGYKTCLGWFSLFSSGHPITALWNPKSDKHPISPYNITPNSHIQVTRREKMITN